MTEKVRQFVADKRGVSPVIGVVLMVAVVVILAAVIGAFVLGLGGDQQATPQASFSYDDGAITMEGGDTIDGANLYIAVDGSRQDSAVGGGEVNAGTEIVTGLDPSNSVSVIYDDGSGESSTLWTTNAGSGGGNNP